MSLRSGHVTPLGVCLLCAITGCGHLLESRAITDFTYALQEQDLEYLRESTSSEFGQSALRRTEALEDLKILRLPQEPPSIVKVGDVSATEKQVTVTNDPDSKSSKQSQLLYKLTRSDDQSDWVVDDIYIKRKQKGLKVTKSVTEQMDLLLTLRDFLDAWETGDEFETRGGIDEQKAWGDEPIGDGEEDHGPVDVHVDQDLLNKLMEEKKNA